MLPTTAPCEDIDTLACQQMHRSRSDICLDNGLAEVACKQFCGRCRKSVNMFNPFIPSGPSDPSKLDQFISKIRDV
ncbi:hypothetical protein DPMN_189300 [Dreissena polymorpha]|uniref:Uncharacterized protein n=1 Tax=Dreissena polymorpha TaxID=45954 RepID=A0A9D4DU33_DREPO|nr:hypothetical protein DPMN_189300 [Dreissena polymorpha]